MRTRTIYITGAIHLPGETAATIHAFRLAQTLALAGFEPRVLIPRTTGRKEDLQPDGTYEYHGIPYVLIGDATFRTNPVGRLGVFCGIGSPLLGYLRQQLEQPLAIICSAQPLGTMARLAAFCRRNKVVLALEVMEWFARAHVDGLVRWLDMEMRMRWLYPSIGRLIVISSLLEKYYTAKGCQVLRLPPVLDTEDPAWKPRRNGGGPPQLKLLFSGSVGRDRQDLILSAVRRLRGEGENVVIHYVGSTRDDLRTALGSQHAVLNDLNDAVVCHGSAAIEHVPDLLGSADYAVLLRERSRWSDACFPSKVPEMFALGVPLICNLTSDLEQYARDGLEALWIAGVSEDAVLKALRRAIAGGAETRERMSKAVRRRAEECFDVKVHAAEVAHFIEKAADGVRTAGV